MKQKRALSDEDKILWHRVARTVKPLTGVAMPPEPDPDAPDPETPAAKMSGTSPRAAAGKKPAAPAKRPDEPFVPFLPAYVPPVSSPSPRPDLDRPTHGRIAKGRLAIDSRIDLHGMTQADAHGALLAFLHRAGAAGHRHVIVITGKGRSKGGDGILRRAVPGWLATVPFRGLVSAWAEAARHHGGEGALYVRLRRDAP